MSATTFYGVTIDCADAPRLAEFYSALTGMEVSYSSPELAALSGDHGIAVNFQSVEDFQAPTWPGRGGEQQFHLDFTVADLDEGEQQVVALGATRAEHQPGEERWRVMLDPAGHPFCLAKSS